MLYLHSQQKDRDDAEPVENRVGQAEQVLHASVAAMHVVEGIQAAANPGLIGDDDAEVAETGQLVECVDDPGKEDHTRWIGEMARVLDQGAVAIEEDGRRAACHRRVGRPLVESGRALAVESFVAASESALLGTGFRPSTRIRSVVATPPPMVRTPWSSTT